MVKNKLLVKGIYWNLLRTVFERVTLLIQQLILARILFPEDFGVYSKITAAFSLISFFSLGGASEFLLSRKKNLRLWLPSMNFYWLNLLLISILLIFIVIKFLSFENEYFVRLVLLYSFSLPFNAFKISDLALLNYEGRYKTIAVSRILFTISLVFSSLILAYLNYSVFSLVFSYVISCLIEFLFLRHKTRITFKINRNFKKLKLLLANGMQLLVHNFSWRLINSFDFLILGYLLDDFKAGLYFMAFSLAVQPISLLMSYLPNLLYSSNLRDNLSLNNVIERSNSFSFYLVFFSTPLFVYVYYYADELILWFLGKKWINSTDVLKVLSVSMIPRVFASQWHLKYLHLGEFKLLSKLSFIFSIVYVFILCLLTYFFDLIGASIATGIFYIFITFSDLNNNYLNNKYFLSIVKSIFSSIIIFFLLHSITTYYNNTNFFISLFTSFLGFIAYFLFLVYIDSNVKNLKRKILNTFKS